MKKFSILIAVVALLATVQTVHAKDVDMIPMRSTAYCMGTINASGKPARIGTAAAARKYMGMTAVIYQRLPDGSVGKCLAEVEIEDTGCADSVIDVRFDNLEQCQDWMDTVYADGCKGKVFVQFIDAKG